MLIQNNYYLCGAMKAGRLILAFIMICFVYLCLHKADNSASGNIPAKECKSEITTSSEGFETPAHTSFSLPEMRCRSSRSSSVRNTSRTVLQTSRQNATSHAKGGFTLKNSGKSLHNHTTVFFSSLMAFPSGINETHHHLVRLRKFII